MSIWFLSASCVLQIFAAAYAIYVLARTRYSFGWGCIAAALTLMGIVRLMALSRLIAGEPVIVADERTVLIVEITAFCTTLLMVFGVVFIGRFFQKILLNEQRFADFSEASSDWLWEIDAQGRMSWVSDDTEGPAGHRFHQVKGKTRQEISDQLAQDQDWDAYQQALDSRSEIVGFEYRYRDNKGALRYARIDGKPLFDKNGEFVGYRGVGTNITEQKRLDHEITEKTLFLNSIIENIPTMVFVKEAKELRFTLFNKAGEELLGFSREDLIGKNDYDFFPEDQADAFVSKDRAVLDSKEVLDIAIEPIETKYRGRRLLHTRKVAMRDRNGVPQFLLGISEDITDYENTREKLAENLELAQHANQAKSQFLAHMSHELRTPLNAITGFAQILETEAFGAHVNPKYKEYSHDIRASSDHLLSIINDVLDLSKIEAGEMQPRLGNFALAEAVGECIALMKSRAPNNPDRFVSDMTKAPENLLGDIRMFRQILLNLLSNADKYTPDDGTIRISAKTEDSGVTVVSVADSGVGIAEGDLEAIFEPFGQARNTVQIAHEGTGLGLPISKRLMELQGGELTLQSTLGEGTTIFLRFPAPEQA